MKKKIIIVILIVIILLGIGGYILFNTNKSTSTLTNSSTKESRDETGIDWSNYEVYDISLDSGNVNITKKGVYNITGSLKNGSIIVDTNSNVKLILNGVSITSKSNPGIYIKKAKNTYIEIKGTNKINTTTSDKLDASIYSKDDLILYGDGKLIINSNKDGISSKDDLDILSGTYSITSSGDGIKGRDSITIKKGKFTIITEEDGIKTTNPDNKGNIVIKDGTFKISSNNDGISSISDLTITKGSFEIETKSTNKDESKKGIKASKNIVIKDGSYTINSLDDAIHSNKNVEIDNGEFNISSSDDGIHADYDVNIKNGTIKISKSYEGIEAYNITIDSGSVSLISDDDGINISDPVGKTNSGMDEDTGGKLTINDGEVYVNAVGDGLDSNGSIYINGGTIHVDGPTNNGNGPLDYNGEFVITGGELIAVGSSGMAQNVSNSSTQRTVMINLDSSNSGKITLGNIKYAPAKSYQSILISSASLTEDSYTLTYGENTKEVTLSGTVTTIGNTSRGGMGGMMGGR